MRAFNSLALVLAVLGQANAWILDGSCTTSKWNYHDLIVNGMKEAFNQAQLSLDIIDAIRAGTATQDQLDLMKLVFGVAMNGDQLDESSLNTEHIINVFQQVRSFDKTGTGDPTPRPQGALPDDDVIIYCDYARYTMGERCSGQKDPKVACDHDLGRDMDMRQIDLRCKSTLNTDKTEAWTVAPRPGIVSQIQVCRWYLQASNGYKIRYWRDISAKAILSRASDKIQDLFGMRTAMDAASLFDHTMLHEMTHAIKNVRRTRDVGYGWKNVVKFSPNKADANADNYAFFGLGARMLSPANGEDASRPNRDGSISALPPPPPQQQHKRDEADITVTLAGETLSLNGQNATDFVVSPSLTVRPGSAYTIGTDVVSLASDAVVIDSSTVDLGSPTPSPRSSRASTFKTSVRSSTPASQTPKSTPASSPSGSTVKSSPARSTVKSSPAASKSSSAASHSTPSPSKSASKASSRVSSSQASPKASSPEASSPAAHTPTTTPTAGTDTSTKASSKASSTAMSSPHASSLKGSTANGSTTRESTTTPTPIDRPSPSPPAAAHTPTTTPITGTDTSTKTSSPEASSPAAPTPTTSPTAGTDTTTEASDSTTSTSMATFPFGSPPPTTTLPPWFTYASMTITESSTTEVAPITVITLTSASHTTSVTYVSTRTSSGDIGPTPAWMCWGPLCDHSSSCIIPLFCKSQPGSGVSWGLCCGWEPKLPGLPSGEAPPAGGPSPGPPDLDNDDGSSSKKTTAKTTEKTTEKTTAKTTAKLSETDKSTTTCTRTQTASSCAITLSVFTPSGASTASTSTITGTCSTTTGCSVTNTASTTTTTSDAVITPTIIADPENWDGENDWLSMQQAGLEVLLTATYPILTWTSGSSSSSKASSTKASTTKASSKIASPTKASTKASTTTSKTTHTTSSTTHTTTTAKTTSTKTTSTTKTTTTTSSSGSSLWCAPTTIAPPGVPQDHVQTNITDFCDLFDRDVDVFTLMPDPDDRSMGLEYFFPDVEMTLNVSLVAGNSYEVFQTTCDEALHTVLNGCPPFKEDPKAAHLFKFGGGITVSGPDGVASFNMTLVAKPGDPGREPNCNAPDC